MWGYVWMLEKIMETTLIGLYIEVILVLNTFATGTLKGFRGLGV